MGDPISAAGTAVGVVSLGIQVCQGLVSYYDGFRDFDHDVDGVLKRISSLRGSLDVLDKIAQRVEIANSDESIHLRKRMDDIKVDLSPLETWMKNCGQTCIPNGFRASSKKLLKQVYWPFKKGTLEQMQSAIDRVQSNLQFALQIFGVDAQSRQLKDVSSTIATVDKRIIRHTQDLHSIQVGNQDILQRQLSQTRLVEDRSDQCIAQMSQQTQNLQAVELGIQHLSRQQDDNTTTLILRSEQRSSSDLQTMQGDIEAASQRQIEHSMALLSQGTALNNQLTVIEQHLAVMASHASSAPVNHGIASDAFQDSLQQSQALLPIIVRNKREYQRSLGMSRDHLTRTHHKCNCRAYLTNRWEGGPWISMHTSFKSKHWPTCAYFEHDDFEQYIEIRLKFCTRALGSCISASLYYARQAGITMILPGLQARRVVSDDSPAFRGLINLQYSLCFDTGSIVNKELFATELSTELDALRKSFTLRRVRPSDTLPDGSTIMHLVCKILNYVVDSGHYGLDEACHFLDALIAEDVPMNERDEGNLIPLDYLLTRLDLTHLYSGRRLQDSSALFTHFLRKSKHWTLPTSFAGNSMLRFYHNESPASTMEILHDAAHMISNVEENLTDFEMEYPLFFAVIQKSDKVLRELLISDIYSSETFDLDYYWAVRYAVQWPDGLRQFLSLSSENIKRHSQDLFSIATSYMILDSLRLLTEAQLPISMETWNFLCSNARRFPPDFFSSMNKLLRHQTSDSESLFYSTRPLPLAAGEALWTAGFRDIYIPTYRWATMQDVPLNLDVLQWFVEKGAALDHGPAHQLAGAICLWRTSAITTPSPFVRTVFESHITDDCACPCSTDGCLPIGFAISEILQKTTWAWQDGFSKHQESLSSLYNLVDSSPEPDQAWMASTCLRVLTFEGLGMMHTCGGSKNHESLAQQEEETEVLESLLQNFEAQLEGYQRSFRAFVDNVWYPKMKEVTDAKLDSWGGLWALDFGLNEI